MATSLPKQPLQHRSKQSSEDKRSVASTPKDNGWQMKLNNIGRSLKWLGVANPKALKSIDYNYVTATLSFAPSKISGINVCHRQEYCESTCLYWQGRGTMNRIQQARINKTNRFFDDEEQAAAEISVELWSLKNMITRTPWFQKRNFKLACRLNCYSDILWENKPYDILNGKTIIEAHPFVQFYDYTKWRYKERDAWTQDNYHLTYSYNGRSDDIDNCLEVLRAGENVNVVYTKPSFKDYSRRGGPGDPRVKWGYPMLNSEISDLRFLDPSPVVLIGCEKGYSHIAV
jgi:hypothetical protein